MTQFNWRTKTCSCTLMLFTLFWMPMMMLSKLFCMPNDNGLARQQLREQKKIDRKIWLCNLTISRKEPAVAKRSYYVLFCFFFWKNSHDVANSTNSAESAFANKSGKLLSLHFRGIKLVNLWTTVTRKPEDNRYKIQSLILKNYVSVSKYLQFVHCFFFRYQFYAAL